MFARSYLLSFFFYHRESGVDGQYFTAISASSCAVTCRCDLSKYQSYRICSQISIWLIVNARCLFCFFKLQYMKAISTHVLKYTEGTVDKREVNAKMVRRCNLRSFSFVFILRLKLTSSIQQVPLRICPVMAEWGLGEIYCSLRERRIDTASE